MSYNLEQNKIKPTAEKRLWRVILFGFLLRAAMLILVLSLKDKVSPYYLSDDIAYEEVARRYMHNAGSLVDRALLDKLLKGYMQSFWPIVMSISAKLFGTIYMGRVINIFLSAACIPMIYKTVLLLSDNEKTALLAGKLFAFLPVPILTSCFPIKDIYLTWATLYAFYIFLLIYQKKKVSFIQVVVCVAAMAGIYFARGAVMELLLIFFAILWMDSLKKEKKYKALLGVVVLCVAALVLFGEEVVEAFSTKIEDYGGYNEASQGGLSSFQMKSWAEFYKLPFAYFFATLQPITMNYFVVGENIWLWLMALTNVSIYPVAIANIVYIFQKKHNNLYWICGVVIYCAIISMCLGISRHYLFLFPLEMINCALCFDRKQKGVKEFVFLGSLALVLLITLLSLLYFI